MMLESIYQNLVIKKEEDRLAVSEASKNGFTIWQTVFGE
jgi:hypothetical protein